MVGHVPGMTFGTLTSNVPHTADFNSHNSIDFPADCVCLHAVGTVWARSSTSTRNPHPTTPAFRSSPCFPNPSPASTGPAPPPDQMRIRSRDVPRPARLPFTHHHSRPTSHAEVCMPSPPPTPALPRLQPPPWLQRTPPCSHAPRTAATRRAPCRAISPPPPPLRPPPHLPVPRLRRRRRRQQRRPRLTQGV